MTYVICGIPGVNAFEGKNRELIFKQFYKSALDRYIMALRQQLKQWCVVI